MPDISDTMKYRNTKGSTSSSPRESRSVVSGCERERGREGRREECSVIWE